VLRGDDERPLAVTRAGLREYHNPLSGVGMGAVDVGWSALLMELVDPEPRAAQSYLGRGAPRT
jgi:hypothetical protein